MPTPLNERQETTNRQYSYIAVQVSLYFYQIEMNLIYKKSIGIVFTL